MVQSHSFSLIILIFYLLEYFITQNKFLIKTIQVSASVTWYFVILGILNTVSQKGVTLFIITLFSATCFGFFYQAIFRQYKILEDSLSCTSHTSCLNMQFKSQLDRHVSNGNRNKQNNLKTCCVFHVPYSSYKNKIVCFQVKRKDRAYFGEP